MIAFARTVVNSGRLCVPATHDGLSLNGPDQLTGGPSRCRVAGPCPDAPLGDRYLRSELGGRFTIMTIDTEAPERIEERSIAAARWTLSASDDETGVLAERYLGTSGSEVYLIRPDHHVTARRDLDDEERAVLSARLFLTLAIQVGDRAGVSEALEIVRSSSGWCFLCWQCRQT